MEADGPQQTKDEIECVENAVEREVEEPTGLIHKQSYLQVKSWRKFILQQKTNEEPKKWI